MFPCEKLEAVDVDRDQALFRIRDNVPPDHAQPLSILKEERDLPTDLAVKVLTDDTDWKSFVKNEPKILPDPNLFYRSCTIARVKEFVTTRDDQTVRYRSHFLSCVAEQGNSGSAVIDNDGTVIGVLHATSALNQAGIFSPLSKKILSVLAADRP